MITDANSLADIDFRMTWKNDAASHIDIYAALRVNFWRDPVYAVRGRKR